ncbi:MAG: aromatic amino acid ammonia-lyase [Bdellovibrionota bacterium]|nr:MAG: aromatic amino acid ammonia-lyase [Bdellovibrionota bacterium]
MELHHRHPVAWEHILAVISGEQVTLASDSAEMLLQRRKQIVDAVSGSPRPAYGFNRGFGHRVDTAVPLKELATLQRNLIRSHACGSGPSAPREVVRAAMLLRAVSLSLGHSGVRPIVIEQLCHFLNNDITPEVPCYGSVGASGDLAPLSHIALALMGEGRVVFRGQSRETSTVLNELGIAPLSLEMKEGLALNNGVQFSTALGIVALDELWALLKTAVLASALGVQLLLGSDTPFDPELQALRPHPGALEVARWLRALCADSPIIAAHRSPEVDGEVQDPYSLRCTPQVLGTVHDLFSEAQATFILEANAATDNPLLLTEDGKFTRIVSGGHFHGMPIAVKIYNLVQGMAIMARLSNMRCVRYVDGSRNRGLGDDLIWPLLDPIAASTSSGYMVAEYLSASLLNTIWGAAMPSHLFSVSTDAGQEDMVSMSATLGVRVLETIPRLAELLAVELAFAAQASSIRSLLPSIPSKFKPAGLSEPPPQRLGRHEAFFSAAVTYPLSDAERKLSPRCEQVLMSVRKSGCCVQSDKCLTPALAEISALVRSRTLLSTAGSFW